MDIMKIIGTSLACSRDTDKRYHFAKFAIYAKHGTILWWFENTANFGKCLHSKSLLNWQKTEILLYLLHTALNFLKDHT